MNLGFGLGDPMEDGQGVLLYEWRELAVLDEFADIGVAALVLVAMLMPVFVVVVFDLAAVVVIVLGMGMRVVLVLVFVMGPARSSCSCSWPSCRGDDLRGRRSCFSSASSPWW